MTKYGSTFDDTHESMRLHRRERRYRGHKLAVAIGHNRMIRSKRR